LYYQGASFGAPSPLKVEGRKLKAQLARRRENEKSWLFEIRIGSCEADARATLTPVIVRLDRTTQYSKTVEIFARGGVYWFPASAGMTAGGDEARRSVTAT
jgi:hypothetical protein